MKNLDDHRPHEVATVICAHCGYAWVAVWDSRCSDLVCPDCKELSRIPDENPLHLLRVTRSTDISKGD
jgi:phage FluMu protein Com